MRWMRSGVAALMGLAVLAAPALVCPCPVADMDSHACCAEPGVRAATSCCLTTPAPAPPAVVDAAAALPESVPVAVALAPVRVVAIAFVPAETRLSPSTPRVLRI